MQKDSKKKEARTPSRRTSKRGKSSSRKKSGDPVANFDQLVEADDSPASVRRFIMDFVAALAAFAGITGQEYEQEGLAERTRQALQHVGAEAISITLRIAIATLSRYAPAVSKYNHEDYQVTADRYAAVLEHPQCPEIFREAFHRIYTDLFVSHVTWTDPAIVRATYAPMREFLDDANYCGTAEGVDESLLRLMETLLPEDVLEAARKGTMGTVGQGGDAQ
jgi:hypothetical protein